MSANNNLHAAKKAKNDEFYTNFNDIAKEVVSYKDEFKGKVVFLNCDDPEWSHFWKFFERQFKEFGLKKLISTHYSDKGTTYKLELENYGDAPTKTELKQNGDFRSEECVKILKEEADIVVTNPPFSLFRDYITLLSETKKKFLIVGSMNAITYKEVYPKIQNNELWLGNTSIKEFRTPEGENKKFGNILWYTNMENSSRKTAINLYKLLSEGDYKRFLNYDGINVNKVVDIPVDYDGVMGVPISFLTKYNPNQFEIVGFRKGDDGRDLCIEHKGSRKEMYFRILIKFKK